MQQPPPGQGWPQQFQQQGYGQPAASYGQPSSPYPSQQGQWSQQPYTPYPPLQGQWQPPYTPNPQWSQQPYGQPPPQPPERKKSKLPIIIGVIVVLILIACVGASVLVLQRDFLGYTERKSVCGGGPRCLVYSISQPTSRLLWLNWR